MNLKKLTSLLCSVFQSVNTVFLNWFKSSLIFFHQCMYLIFKVIWTGIFVSTSVQFSHSVMSDILQPHGLQHSRTAFSITNSQSLLKLMSIESVMPSNHLILCHPLLLLPSIFPSIRVFSNELVLHIRWPKYWHFSFSISPSNEYSGPISFRIDWLDLLAVLGTLKSLLQHHSSKPSILHHSAFFVVLSRVFSNTTVQNHQFTTQLSL